MHNHLSGWPKISVVTPNYNGGRFLEKTILSVIDQDYPNLEYIIIDGESSDDSVEIIKKYEKRISFWMSERDDGLYSALQKGFDRSSGEIMAWLNSDDLYHSGALYTVAEIFSNFREVEWLLGKPTVFDEQGRCVYVENSRRWSKYEYYLGEFKGLIQQESTFWRRSLWERAGEEFSRELKYAADYELWLRFFRYVPLYQVQALTGGYRARSGDQLSVEHLDEYKQEVNELLGNWDLNGSERKILKKNKRSWR